MGLFSSVASGLGLGKVFEKPIKQVGDYFTGADQRRAIRGATNDIMGHLQKGADLFMPSHQFFEGMLPQLQESGSIDGVSSRLGQILNGGALDPLIDRAQESANAYMQSQGLNRSSYAADTAARIPVEQALNFEGMLRNREMQNAGVGAHAGNNLASIYSSMGNTLAQSQLGQTASRRQGIGGILDMAGSVLGGIFSDETLKDNLTKIGDIDGLNVYRWSWNDEAKEKYGLTGDGVGFSAQEVSKIHPDLVTVNEEGHLKVNTDELLKRVA